MMRSRMQMLGPEHIAALSAGQRRAHAKRLAGEGFIYVAAVLDSDAIKIGHSLEPEFRIRTMPLRCRLLGYFRATARTERLLHRLLKAHRHPDFPEATEIYQRSVLARPDLFGPAPKKRKAA